MTLLWAADYFWPSPDVHPLTVSFYTWVSGNWVFTCEGRDGFSSEYRYEFNQWKRHQWRLFHMNNTSQLKFLHTQSMFIRLQINWLLKQTWRNWYVWKVLWNKLKEILKKSQKDNTFLIELKRNLKWNCKYQKRGMVLSLEQIC